MEPTADPTAEPDCRNLQDSACLGPSFSPADELLAVALAAGKTRLEAAAAAGMSERTVYNRLADPGFQRRVKDLNSEFVVGSAGRLASAAVSAADTLAGLLAPPNPPSVRLMAARAILDLTFRGFDASVADRLSALEQQAESHHDETDDY